MAAHLSHKIRWDYMAEYVSAHVDSGVTFPVGECGRIHARSKKHNIQIDMRKYITDDMLCTDEDCETVGERRFRKSDKRKPFLRKRQKDETKLKMFAESFYKAVEEFASTELRTPAKPVVYDDIEEKNLSLLHCDECNEFIRYLEFGDKQKLFEFSDSELADRIWCRDGSQAIGYRMPFLIHQLLRFYVYSNVIVYMGLRKTEDWAHFMRPNSYFRRELLYAHGGQTFLPHSRRFLDNAMIDLSETRELSRRLFRAIYFYVMCRMKLDSSYKLSDDFDAGYFGYW